MKVSLDGGVTYVDAPEGVRVMYENVLIPGEDAYGEVLFNFSTQGIITDVWTLESNVGTESETIDELVERLVEKEETMHTQCSKSSSGKHEPDWLSMSIPTEAASDEFLQVFIDVNCKYCGLSGYARIDPDTINWEQQT